METVRGALTVPRLSGLSDVAANYKAVLCDVWGVIHNGIAPYDAAAAALRGFREAGGHVVLITNAPRPSAPVVEQLDGMGFPREAYDGIVSSGDVTRADLLARGTRRAFMLGPDRDLGLFEDTGIALVGPDDAELMVCTGLLDDRTETPEDYRERFARFVGLGLEFLCANPDILVERGDTLLYCAGALAEVYRTLGGTVTHFGKPHAAIYRAALDRLAAIAGRPVPREEVLVIGDGLFTDIRGAVGNGFDALFVTAGVHAGDLGGLDPDPAAVADRLAREGLTARGFLPRLCW